jgi:hypothetical protein
MHVVEALDDALHDLLDIWQLEAPSRVDSFEEGAAFEVLGYYINSGVGLINAVYFQYIFMVHGS